MKNYRKRIVDEILSRKLEGKGAVLIEGPKWSVMCRETLC